MKVELKLTGLNGVLDALRKLPPEIVSKNGGPVKSALRKGARLIQQQALANLRVVTSNQTESGMKESTGLLADNVVVTRGKAPANGKGERYLVRVRRKGYPRQGKPVSTQQTAQRLEYGTSKQPAEPWLRPAFENKASEAIRTAEAELLKGIERAVKKVSKGE